jgi:ABC-type lipopolysaccharide export system ATPase subunit
MVELLRLDAVTAGYRDTVVLEGISVVLNANEAWAILGRNGVGKTTLLMTLMGLTTMRSGTIIFDDADITTLDPHRRARAGLGYVPQETRIYASQRAKANGRARGSMIFSRASPSAGAITAISSRAASSKCWPSAARSSAIRSFSCSTSPSRAWRRLLSIRW